MKATILLAGIALFSLLGCGDKEPKVETEDQKIMYALGLGLAESGPFSKLKELLVPEELDLIGKGFKDAMLDKEPMVNLQEYGPKMSEALNQRLAKAAEGKKAEGEAPKMSPEDEKIMYAVGLALAESTLSNLRGQFTAEEINLIAKGFKDAILNKERVVSLQEYSPKLKDALDPRLAKAAEGKKAEGKAFLDKAAAEAGAVKTATGLVYQELVPGTGPQPGPTSKVQFHYTVSLVDGRVLDSSVKNGAPVEKSLHEVFPGWAEGLQLMKVGGKARLVIPPEQAFGDRGIPSQGVPPGATLVCEVELLGIL